MKLCEWHTCTRYPTMGKHCITHYYENQGKALPANKPVTPGGWMDLWRRGQAAKKAAIAQVGEAADPVFKAAALDAIRQACARQDTFTADDVWMLLEASGAPQTAEPRALGAVMTYAAKLGLIRATEYWRESVLPQRHSRPIRVWKAL